MNWNDITIKQFYELQKINNLYDDEFDRKLAMIAICQGVDFEEALEYRVHYVAELSKKYEFLNEPMKTKVVTRWKDYNFELKLSNLKAGQMIDFLETCKEDVETKLHIILAILDNGKVDFETKEKDLLDCPVPIVKGISDFFFHKYEMSQRIIQEYSLQKLKKMSKILKNQLKEAAL